MKNKNINYSKISSEEFYNYLLTQPFSDILNIAVELLNIYQEKLNIIGENSTRIEQKDTRFPITQEEFDKYFRIKDSKGRGRKPKATTTEQ